MADLWWLPSLIVFGVTAFIVVGATRLLRSRRGTAGRISNVVRARAAAASQPLSSGAPVSQDVATLRRDANIALVRLDDAIDAATDELGFAAAQFGDGETAGFAQTLDGARKDLAEAFTLAQKLDDAWPDSEREQRDWTRRILHLATAAAERIAGWDDAFAARRRGESNAPASLDAIRASIQDAGRRLPEMAALVKRMLAEYSPAIVTPIAANPEAARAQLEAAEHSVAAATAGLADAPPVPVAAQIHAAEESVRGATLKLDAVSALDRGLTEQKATRELLVQDLEEDLAPAKAVRDTPPDPEHGAVVGEAVAAAEAALAAVRGSSIPVQGGLSRQSALGADPLADIAELREASERLDTALVGARNQSDRLRHTRAAFAGAVVIAQSQIEAARSVITGGRARQRRSRSANEARRSRARAGPRQAGVRSGHSARLGTPREHPGHRRRRPRAVRPPLARAAQGSGGPVTRCGRSGSR